MHQPCHKASFSRNLMQVRFGYLAPRHAVNAISIIAEPISDGTRPTVPRGLLKRHELVLLKPHKLNRAQALQLPLHLGKCLGLLSHGLRGEARAVLGAP